MAEQKEKVIIGGSIGGIIAAIALLLLVLGVLKFMGVSPI